MTPDLTTLIAELEEALKAATPGPWMADDNYVLTATREVARCYASPDTRGTLPGANARLIALMRTHLPALLSALSAAEARAEAAEEERAGVEEVRSRVEWWKENDGPFRTMPMSTAIEVLEEALFLIDKLTEAG